MSAVGRCRGRVSYNKVCVEQDSAERNIVLQSAERVKSALSQLDAVLAHRGKRRRSVGGEWNIIETDDADIFRYLVSKLLTLGDRSAGECILTAYDRSHSHVQQARQVFFHTF